LVVHDEPKLKLGFETGPEFEPKFFFLNLFFFCVLFLRVLLNYFQHQE
jgi:hypothetical protein